MADELPIHLFAGPDELKEWLEGSGDSCDGVWLKIAKKGRRLRKFVAMLERGEKIHA